MPFWRALGILLLGCGATQPSSHTPADEPVAEGVHPCEVLVPRARRSLAPMLHTVGAPPDSDREPFTTCIRDGEAAWMFFPRNATVEWLRPQRGNLPDLPTDEAVPAITITFQMVYATGDQLVVGEPQIYEDDPLNINTDIIEVKAVSDIDGDGRGELAVRFSETTYEDPEPSRFRIFTARDTVTRYAPAENIPVIDYRDVDDDGRLDIISDGIWSATMCGNDPPPEPLPPILHHAQPDGTFSVSSAGAAAFLREQCPSSPGTLVGERDVEYETLKNVACARAWGASAEEVQQQLRREYPEREDDDFYCAYDLAATLEWAAIDPPVRLDQIR